MTAPVRQAERLTDRLAEIERAAKAAAVARLAAEIASLTVKGAAASTVSPGAFRQILERLTAIFDGVPERAQKAAEDAVRAAFDVGLQDAADGLGMLRPLDISLPDNDVEVGRLVEDQLAGIRSVLRSNEDIPVALAMARKVISRVDGSVSWNVHRAAADAVEATATELGLQRRWVAERDACLHCLAYQGQVAEANQPFIGGLSFATKPLSTDPVRNSPLHSFCRCIIQVHDAADSFVLDALKREASRSVLRGSRLPSESERERLRAADRLLRAGTNLPKTVQERARKAVKRGNF